MIPLTETNALIRSIGKSQREAAEAVNIAKSTMCDLLKHGYWPRKDRQAMRERLIAWITDSGADQTRIEKSLEEVAKSAACAFYPKNLPESPEEAFTMIPKQVLTSAARRKFGITREIFSDNISCLEDIFFSPDLRYARECLHSTARHGGFLALVGESGSGKSTLRRDLISRLQAEDSRVVVIEPYVLGLDKQERRSLGVSARHITESILAALDPEAAAALSAERVFRRMHERLKESARAGNRHLLIIEEAHSLPLRTIKQLKRFYELEDGLTRLLSILLVGQPELKSKLAAGAAAWDVREVVQRLELLELAPLDDLEGYVRHRCTRAGAKFEDIFDPSALDGLRLRLSGPAPRNGQSGASLLYPLLIGNCLTAAINRAADLKMPKVTADVVAGA